MNLISKLLIILSIVSLYNLSDAATYKVLFINSYHEGYPPSDEVTQTFVEKMGEASIEAEVFYMDTKRNQNPIFIAEICKQIVQKIVSRGFDIIVAADDNANRYIVAPYLKNTSTPVVFCGVNWSCSQYGLPAKNVTGILEVLPLEASIQSIKKVYPDAQRLLVLSENSNSEQSNKTLLHSLFMQTGLVPSYELVDSYEQWKKAYSDAQHNYDLIYLPTNGSISGWDADDAKKFVLRTTQIPTFTCDEFMMDYCVFGRTKIAAEHGTWAAKTALKILEGCLPSEIKVSKNMDSKVWINQSIADQIHFKIPDSEEAAENIIRK